MNIQIDQEKMPETNKPSEKFGDSAIAPMHTTEHIINRVMINMFHCGRSVEAHIEKKKSKLDYRLEHCPNAEEKAQIEQHVNEIIQQDLPVTTEYTTQAIARGRFDLDRLPDDATETVRIVHVGDFDECLCVGQHVEHTGEIGAMKMLSDDWNEDTHIWRMRFKLIAPN